MVKVKWTDFALENLIAIGDYIERDSYFYALYLRQMTFREI